MSWKANRLLHEVMERYLAARGGAISSDEATQVLRELEPLSKAAIRYENAVTSLVKSCKKREKNMVKATRQSLRRAEKQRKDYIAKNRTYRRNMNDAGYANGHQVVPAYSPSPTWHKPGGRFRGTEN